MKIKSLLILSLTGLLFTSLFSCKKDSTTDPTPVVEKAPQTSDASKGFMFYNSANGVATFGEVTNAGYKDIKAYEALLGAGWTQVVPYKGQLFCYNATSGKAMMFDGVKVVKEYTDFSNSWSHIVALDDKYLLFYNKVSGAAAWGKFDNNIFTQITSNAFSSGWTSIVAFGSSVWFYTDAPAGTTAVGNFDGTKFTQTLTSKVEPRLTFLPFGDKRVCWYSDLTKSANTGFMGLYDINGAGTVATIQTVYLYRSTFAFSASATNENFLIFYGNGKLETLKITNNNTAALANTQTNLSGGWTHIVPIKFN
jgi:hypothetical protein